MDFLNSAISSLPEFAQLCAAVRGKQLPAVATGLSQIHKAVMIHSLCVSCKRRAFVIAADENEAQKLASDLSAMGFCTVNYPARDFSLRDTAGVSHEYEHERLRALSMTESIDTDCVIGTIDAFLQFTLPPEELKKSTRIFSSGQTVSPDEIITFLLAAGYERSDLVEGAGQFSRRGGILDFFPANEDAPVRIEFWDDEIDTISLFDPQTQRRTDTVKTVRVIPAVEAAISNPSALSDKLRTLASSLRGKTAPAAKEILLSEAQKLSSGVHLTNADKFLPLLFPSSTLLDYCKDDCLLFVSDPIKEKEKMRTVLWQWGEDLKDYLSEGILCKGLDHYSGDWPDALAFLEKKGCICLDSFARGSYDFLTRTLVNISARQNPAWNGSYAQLEEDLRAMLYNKYACAVLCAGEKAGRLAAENLRASGISAEYIEDPQEIPRGTVVVTSGTLSSGFEFPAAHFGLITNEQQSPAARRKRKKHKDGKEIYSLSELTVGDYVVHAAHGIGMYDGIHKLEMQGVTKDYIKVRYAKDDILYVPVTQLDMVSKYIGPRENTTVKLHKLGGVEWQNQKARVRHAVKDMAKDLIKLYAARMDAKGFAFSEDSDWQHDFEARFEFDETDDQLQCIQEIKADMERGVPMDRLLCGDVGFGKTEVALRAAFKCISDGKQCALLVPTTILAFQHYQTITRRMEGFPIKAECLSRFKSSKQQTEIIQKLARGELDMIVGTHRLLSKDIRFRDLGLVIIDEEQRFGVAQKEKLKDLCKSVDILTLSATPIPRTLSMALSGIRDMSVIEEAPHDRFPVQTYVLEYDPGVVADAIRRELRRGGQVYYLHNDIATIERTAAAIQTRVPEAKVGFAHGKMTEGELSEIWRALLEQEIDVLVCTTIIETGVDVPNVNTLIIDNADHMGLSQLHQLRGRVGRSSRRAYAYFTFTRNKVLTEISQKRLSAIREFTEFGSGFKIAMRDLEIRGAGNILGGEQHGHMESVGYDLYLKLLDEAVGREKGKEVQESDLECFIDIQIEAHIPESYISNTNQRLEIYRRIADIRDSDDAEDVIDELIDRFGNVPDSVMGLVRIALLRNMALSMGITEIKQQGRSLMLYRNSIDLKLISALGSSMRGRVVFGTGSKPYLSIKTAATEKLLDVLESTLLAIQKALKNA